MSYLAVDDVDARVKKAIAAGAKLMKPIFDVPNVGRIAILTEPGGAGVGWMTPVNLTDHSQEFNMQPHKIVSQSEWLAARKAFLETEKQFTERARRAEPAAPRAAVGQGGQALCVRRSATARRRWPSCSAAAAS